MQEARAEGRLRYKKVLGSRNPADSLTKYMPATLMDQHIETVGLEFRGGRAESAPGLNSVKAYTEEWREKLVRFDPLVEVRHVAAKGKGLKVNRRSTRASWRPAAAAAAAEGELRG